MIISLAEYNKRMQSFFFVVVVVFCILGLERGNCGGGENATLSFCLLCKLDLRNAQTVLIGLISELS